MTVPTLRYEANGPIRIDLDGLIGTRALVQGVSGSGKSTALRALLEATHGRVQHFVIDREGELATLREKYAYVLAGKDGDIPVHLRTAKLLVRRVMELHVSTIADLSDLNMQEQRQWVRDAFTELVHLPRDLWRPLLVILDEGHIFAPERGSGESVATSAVIDLASLGRKRGYSLLVATQRLSKLHKDCAAELLNKFIGYTDDVDLKRAADQLGMTKEQSAQLKQLEWGQFYVYGPAVVNQHGQRRLAPTLVRSPDPKTKAPERGQARPPAPPPPAEIKRLLAQLADLPKEAEEEGRTVAELQRQVKDLRSQLRTAERGIPKLPSPTVRSVEKVVEKVVEKPVDRPVIGDKHVKALEKLVEQGMGLTVRLGELSERLSAPVREIARALTQVTDFERRRLTTPPPGPRMVDLQRFEKESPYPKSEGNGSKRRAPQAHPGTGPVEILPAQQQILDSIAWWESIGVASPTRQQVGLMAHQSWRSSQFDKHVATLQRAGLLRYPESGSLGLTQHGRPIAVVTGDRAQSRNSNEEAQREIKEQLTDGQRRILDELIKVYPMQMDREQLGAAAEQSWRSSQFDKHIARLEQLGLAHYPAKGAVAAADILFHVR